MNAQIATPVAPARTLIMIEAPETPRNTPAELAAALQELPVTAPAVTALDLGLTRGDGLFETVLVIDGQILAGAAHFQRMARSAQIMDLPAPDEALYRAAVSRAVSGLGDLAAGTEVLCKIALTRGQEDLDSPCTGWALAWVSLGYDRLRRDGVELVTLSRGYARSAASECPWLLIGAKTLSYAINTAAKREALRRGAFDALFTTSDGYILEGPTWNVVLLIDGVAVTPDPAAGLLPGTTSHEVLRFLAQRGYETQVRDVRVEELEHAEFVWTTGSGVLAVPVLRVDEHSYRVDAELTTSINDFLLSRRS